MLNLIRNRDLDVENRSTGEAGYMDIPFMRSNDPFGDRQTQSGATAVGRKKCLEDPFLLFLGDAGTGIGHRDFNVTAPFRAI